VSVLIIHPILYLKALRELGPRALLLYAHYQLALRSGSLQRATPDGGQPVSQAGLQFEEKNIPIPARDDLERLLPTEAVDRLVAEAEEITAGQVRLFGGPPVPLVLRPPGPLAHWTQYERGRSHWGVEDVKLIWEPGRFGWTFTLGRAYLVTGNERFCQTFWQQAEAFMEANPPNLGPHWVSAQEVALRLIAFAFALGVFGASISSTAGRRSRLVSSIAAHAARIPPSLNYARAQHNNHLLTEAAGLYTAGLVLPQHPMARRWRSWGWRWLNTGLQSQIAADGTYAQHSANYHRLMLQTALWVYGLNARSNEVHYSRATLLKLAAAARWLWRLIDPNSGQAPNLGPNDGAYIFPLSSCPFYDYRPVVQAAALAFLNERPYQSGLWDEMGLWFKADHQQREPASPARAPTPPGARGSSRKKSLPTPHILRSPNNRSWAYLRAARFNSRPGHADQLHMDLWWRGLNLALDAGTYLYNADPPWQNSLSGTSVHNTITVNGQDQMRRAGRFLWLDWAQANLVDFEQVPVGDLVHLTARHNGYRRFNAIHERSVSVSNGIWRVHDRLLHIKTKPAPGSLAARLHWLLPDWAWELEEALQPDQLARLSLDSPFGRLSLEVTSSTSLDIQHPQVTLARAGVLLAGSGDVAPIQGWYSPSYAQKKPVLSFSYEISGHLPLELYTTWRLP
jgi:hypothetical protein